MFKYLKFASDCIKQNKKLLKKLIIHNFGNVSIRINDEFM